MTFTLRFLSSPPFSLAGHLVGFILVGRVFRTFRILGLGERKGRWAMEQDFHGDFQVNVIWFFAFFSGVLYWIVLILVWFERSLHSAQVSGQSRPWPLKLMTSQAVERTWIRTDGYGRLRGKWVKIFVSVLNPNFDLKFERVPVWARIEIVMSDWTHKGSSQICTKLRRLRNYRLIQITAKSSSFAVYYEQKGIPNYKLIPRSAYQF